MMAQRAAVCVWVPVNHHLLSSFSIFFIDPPNPTRSGDAKKKKIGKSSTYVPERINESQYGYSCLKIATSNLNFKNW
jgi:hypothetical protein